MKDSIGLVISSCDDWYPVWPFVEHSVRKYWTRDWSVWFITNELDPPCGIPVKTGNENWCETSRRALKYIESEIVLWLFEDCVLTDEPDWEMLKAISEFVSSGKVDMVRLCGIGLSKSNESLPNSSLLLLTAGSKDKFLLQPSLWRKSAFLDLLDDHQIDPWEFEAIATRYGRNYRVACLTEGTFPVRFTSHVMPDWDSELVERGCWTYAAVRYAETEGIPIRVTPGAPVTEEARRLALTSPFLEGRTRGNKWTQQ